MRLNRGTSRPLNHCRNCGSTWFPRGQFVSAICPRCGSADVELALTWMLRGVGYLVALPFMAIWFVITQIGALVAAGEEASRPARRAVWDSTTGAGTWVLSIRHDLSGEAHPALLLSKLLVIVAGCVGLGIGVVSLVRWAAQ